MLGGLFLTHVLLYIIPSPLLCSGFARTIAFVEIYIFCLPKSPPAPWASGSTGATRALESCEGPLAGRRVRIATNAEPRQFRFKTLRRHFQSRRWHPKGPAFFPWFLPSGCVANEWTKLCLTEARSSVREAYIFPVQRRTQRPLCTSFSILSLFHSCLDLSVCHGPERSECGMTVSFGHGDVHVRVGCWQPSYSSPPSLSPQELPYYRQHR